MLPIIVCILSLIMSGCQNNTSELATIPHQETSQIALNNSTPPDYQKSAAINVELGLGYLAQGQVSRAKAKLTHALKIANEMSEPHSAMAYFLEMTGDIKEAEAEHRKAIKYAKETGAVYNNYGAFLCRQNHYKEADQAFQRALTDKKYTRTAEVYENAGLCALKAKNEIEAEQYLKTAIRRDPSRSSAMLELAALNLVQGKFNDTKNLLTQHKGIAEPSARSLWLGIQLAKALEDQQEAHNQFLQLKSLFQDSPEYQAYLKSLNKPLKVKP